MSRRNRSESFANEGLKQGALNQRVYTPKPRPKHKDNVMKYSSIFLAVLVLAMVGVGYFDKQAQQLEAAKYCKMVKLHTDTDGAAGWPDYNRQFNTQCTPDGRLAVK